MKDSYPERLLQAAVHWDRQGLWEVPTTGVWTSCPELLSSLVWVVGHPPHLCTLRPTVGPQSTLQPTVRFSEQGIWPLKLLNFFLFLCFFILFPQF